MKLKQFLCNHEDRAFFNSGAGFTCPKCNKVLNYPGEETVLVDNKVLNVEVWKTNLPQLSCSWLIHLWHIDLSISFYIFCIRISVGD